MRILGWPAEESIKPLQNASRQRMLKALRLRVYLRPVKPKEPHQKTLNNAMTPKHIERLTPSLRRQRNAAIPRRPKESAPCKPLHHRGDSPLGQGKLLG